MKFRRVQLAVAIAATLAAPAVQALGLGPITVRSGLNEPLRAEIPILEASAEEAAGIQTRLASAADFARVGLSAGNVPVPLEFAVVTGANGRPAISVTSREPVREPLVSVLIEVNWPNGRLLREYNILLDPPRVAPAISAPAPPVARQPATTAPATPEPEPAPAVATAPTPPAARPAPAPAPSARPAPPPAAAAPPAPAAPLARADRVTVRAGDTLWEIAAANRPRPTITVDQMMIAIQRENPQAFIGGNINRLRQGATLAMPDEAKIAAVSPAAARAEVEVQRAAALAPRPASEAPAPSAPRAAARPAEADSRLEVLPPRSGGEGRGASGERAGVVGGTDARRVAELDADLKRAREQIATRDQEVRELRSRVSELEKIDRDRQGLVALKDSELAALRQQLAQRDAELARLEARVRELEAAAGAPATAAATPPAAVATAPEPPPAEPVAEAAAPEAEPVAPSEPVTTESSAAEPAVAEAAPPEAAAPAEPAPAEPAVEEPAAPAPVAPVAEALDAAAEPPMPPATPWWQKPIVLAIGGGLVLLGLLAALLGRRRRAAAGSAAIVGEVAARPSVADAFAGSAEAEVPAAPPADGEQRLLEHLARAPNDLDAHLELLRTYRARGDLERFETAANAMYAQVYDPSVPQWQEALAMGRELMPDHPLFAEPAFLDRPVVAREPEAGDRAEEWEALDIELTPEPPERARDGGAATLAPPAPAPQPEPTIEFEVPSEAWTPRTETPAPAPAQAAPQAPAMPTPSLDLDFDFDLEAPDGGFGGASRPMEDPVGTKLDLARAYIDMGDIDGARAMLQEVIAEGAEIQRQEARRLLDSLG
jgi:pilus assembly protein FimV